MKSATTYSQINLSWFSGLLFHNKLREVCNGKHPVFQKAWCGVLHDLHGCFLKWWYPQIIHFNRVFHCKPSILGYPYFWKRPYGSCTPKMGQNWRPQYFSWLEARHEKFCGTVAPELMGIPQKPSFQGGFKKNEQLRKHEKNVFEKMSKSGLIKKQDLSSLKYTPWLLNNTVYLLIAIQKPLTNMIFIYCVHQVI